MSHDTPDERRLRHLIAVAIAADSAEIRAQLRSREEELARTNRILAATTSIARALGTETDLDRILELIVTHGRALMDARAMLILLPDGDELEIVASAGDSGRALPGVRVPMAGSTTAEVLRDGRPRRVPACRLGISPASFGIEGVTNCLLVPLVFRGRSLGVLLALDRVDAAATFSVDDEELLLAFAVSAATAVATGQNATELRLRDALEGAEQERHRWARELHDETLQGLAELQLQLSIAAQRSHDEETTAMLRDVLAASAVEIQNLRTLITELRPAALDELGVAPALESLVDGVATSTGLVIDLHVDLGGDRPGTDLETTLYRLVQEALTNVVKHASATRCLIEVIRCDDTFEVVVRDDGCGLSADALDGREGFGVTGMRERARLAGGSLTLGPSAAGGTELHARLPVA